MTRAGVQRFAIAAIFAGALLANLRANGSSPIAWTDTFNDETLVRQCVVDSRCTTTGVGTSLAGFLHGVSWFELRSLLGWLGLGLDGAHVVIQVLNAFALALCFAIARRLGGQLAGLVAVWVFVSGLAALRIQMAALFNSPPLPFFGAIFVLACIAIVERPGFVAVIFAAAVAAIMANIHLACVLTGLSLVAIALLAPRHRLAYALCAAVVFAVATVAVSPPSWAHDAATLLQRQTSIDVERTAELGGTAVIVWTALAALAWIACHASGAAAWARCRQHMLGPLAVAVPFIVAFVVAWGVGMSADGKYLAHVIPATAIAVALPVARAIRQLWHALFTIDHRPIHTVSMRATQLAPFVVALLLPLTTEATKDRAPTVSELHRVDSILRGEHRWTMQQTMESLKADHGIVVLMGLRELGIATTVPEPASADPAESAVLLSLDRRAIPHPLPASWRVVQEWHERVRVLIFTRSRLDWSRFDVCDPVDGAPASCRTSRLTFDPSAPGLEARHLPMGGPRGLKPLRLRVPLRASTDAEAVFMPRMPGLCAGQIVADGDGIGIAPDGRSATIIPTAAGNSADAIELEWILGSSQCSGNAYDGWPPFFIAGDVETVRQIETILRAQEGGHG